MASISSASSANMTSSLYNSANVISGLASGLDTEGMIESLVQSYNTKIQNLTNQATKIEWKQESYRNIIAKMYAYSNKYTSYTSSTNLLSQSFFNNAVNVATQGKYAEKISASGRTDSDIVIKSVDQLATAARYVTDSNLIGSKNGRNIEAEEGLDLTDTMKMGTLQGSLSLNYGNKTISISFNNMKDLVEGRNAQERAQSLANIIQEKLGEETITLASGESVKASDRIQVSASGGKITFSDASSAKNDVYINGVSGDVGKVLGLESSKLNDEDNRVRSIDVAADTKFVNDVPVTTILSNQTMNVNLDGTTKAVRMPAVISYGDGSYTIRDANGVTRGRINTNNATEKQKQEFADAYVTALNVSLSKSFGDKVTASNLSKDGKLQLQLTAPEGSELLVNSDVGEVLNIGNTASNYLSTSKTLGDLLGTDENGDLKGLSKNYDTGLYDFYLNGTKVGSYDASTTLAQLMSDVNASDAGVKLTYSNTTREFVFTAKDTGEGGKIQLGGGLAEAMFGRKDLAVDTTKKTADWLGEGTTLAGKKFSATFANGKTAEFTFNSDSGTLDQMLKKIGDYVGDGAVASFNEKGDLVITDKDGKTYGVAKYGSGDEVASKLSEKAQELTVGGTFTAGTDAEFTANVNGSEIKMVRSSNTTTIDGLTIKLKGTFDDKEGEGVSFQRSVDSDKIVDALKTMIADYNDMMSEIRSAYATMPYQTSSGAFKSYEPLSDEDRATMSESAIQAYEAKAKQGILFGDSLLSGLYEKLRSAFDASSTFGAQLAKMGISVGYNGDDGSSYVALDETKLRQILEEDPDIVTETFAGSASQPGIMQGLKTQLDRYAGTTGATKGLLVEQAGTPLSSASLLSNTWQKQIDELGNQVEKWQDKLSDRVDYYTSMFSRLEVLINQMNSQSSTLAGLMGG